MKRFYFYPNFGLTNLWSAFPKWHTPFFFISTRYSLLSKIFYFFCLTSVSVLWKICIYIYIYIHIHTYTHIWLHGDCVWITVKIVTVNPCTGMRFCRGRTAFHDHGTRKWWRVSVTPGRFSPLGKTRYPLYRRLGDTQGRSGQVRKISPPPAFDPRTVQPVASRYTVWATRPTRITVATE